MGRVKLTTLLINLVCRGLSFYVDDRLIDSHLPSCQPYFLSDPVSEESVLLTVEICLWLVLKEQKKWRASIFCLWVDEMKYRVLEMMIRRRKMRMLRV